MRYLAIILLSFMVLMPVVNDAEARKVSSAKVYKFKGNPKYAAITVNADSGKILHQENATRTRHPASLTKMMTLYLTFEAIKTGKLKMSQRMRVSKEAASRPQTNLSLKEGDTITVRNAVLGLIVRSANDAAVVLAETMAGSEENFAKVMTKRAKQLGMKKTTFRNASGLHHPKQITTAKDMALLGIALKKHYGEFYHYFSRTQFTFKGKTYTSHNKVSKNYPGADGLKTGYINASGFNLVTSANRRGDRIVGVVMGGKSGKTRDAQMVKLLDQSFIAMAQNRTVRATTNVASASRVMPRLATNTAGIYPRPKPGAALAAVRTASGAKRVTFEFVPYPKEKPRYLAQVR